MAQLEVARIEQGRTVRQARQVDHRTAQHMTGWRQHNAVTGVLPRLIPFQGDHLSFESEALLQ